MRKDNPPHLDPLPPGERDGVRGLQEQIVMNAILSAKA